MSTTSTYQILYGSLASVDRMLQLQTTGSTKPNDDDVLHFIEEIEDGINARNLGSQSISGAIFDATEWNRVTEGVVYSYPESLTEEQNSTIIIPPYTPIITISSGFLYINHSSLGNTTDWELLKEGPGSDTDYVIAKRLNKRTGKYLGFGIQFYGDQPIAGRNRIKANITYGENTSTKILQEYTTLQVAKKVIMARLFSGNPSNVATYTAGTGFQTYVNTQYDAQMRFIDARIAEIEAKYFSRDVPYTLIRGI